jgi:hypothetical protein
VLVTIDGEREYFNGLFAIAARGRRTLLAPVTPAEIVRPAKLAALSDRFFVVIQDTDALALAARAAWITGLNLPVQ